VLAHTWFESGRYLEAERGYGQVVQRLPAGDPLQAEAVERLAASVYRQAEARRAAGDLRGAVTEFLRVGVVAPTATTRPAAEFDAATLLAGLAAWAEAATVLEQFRRSFPGHALEARVTRDLATAYLNDGRPQQAAREYERVAGTASEPAELRRAARWQAAELDATGGDVASARRNYAAYVSEYPAPLAPAFEARYELARLAGIAGDGADRTRWLAALVAADAGAGPERTDRTRTLAAGAALQLARPLDVATRTQRLTVPLDRSLLARKYGFEAALAAYARAADYAIAPVSTTATYAMAELYRDFGRALLGSERPHDLSPDELEQYDLLLEEQAFPFEEKAIALHERNARQVAAGRWDDAVRASYVALAELAPGRYARAERTRDLDAATTDFAAGGGTGPADAFGAALYNQIGIAHRRAGRLAEARAAYERALAADPTQPEAHCNLAVLQDLYLGDPHAALPNLERCQALVAGTDGQPATWLAELKARIGQVERTAEAQP
jgi:tetratricopeptide (TPR) repeat protein